VIRGLDFKTSNHGYAEDTEETKIQIMKSRPSPSSLSKILSSNPRSKNTTQTSSLNEQESDSTPASSSLILELWDIHRNQTDFHLRSVFSVCSVVDQIR